MAKKLAHDKALFTVVVLLVALGLVMVYSASAALAGTSSSAGGPAANPFFLKQAIAAGIGFVAMLSMMHVDYRRLKRPAMVYALLGGALALLVAVLFAPLHNDTHRWFVLGPLSFQPSELAKLALIVYVAYQIDRKQERADRPELLVPVSLVVGIVCGLVMLQPDMGTAVLLGTAAVAMLFFAGLPWRYLAGGATLALPALFFMIVSAPYRRRRVLAFMNPEGDPLGANYQVQQSLIAVGSGGLLGVGLGESGQKLHFLPQPHTDFIFAIVAEELGMVGALAIVGLFGMLLWRGIVASLAAPDLFGRYLGLGLTTALVVQALVNISVALSLMPTKGIPMPFLSYGGSSLVVSMAACGVLLNLSEHA